MSPVRLEPSALRSRVKQSTTAQLCLGHADYDFTEKVKGACGYLIKVLF